MLQINLLGDKKKICCFYCTVNFECFEDVPLACFEDVARLQNFDGCFWWYKEPPTNRKEGWGLGVVFCGLKKPKSLWGSLLLQLSTLSWSLREVAPEPENDLAVEIASR